MFPTDLYFLWYFEVEARAALQPPRYAPGLDNDLSTVIIIILIDAHVFPFVHIGKRYNGFFINLQRLSSKKTHNNIIC